MSLQQNKTDTPHTRRRAKSRKTKAPRFFAGVSPEGAGAHRIVIGGDLAPFADPDGFAWETVGVPAHRQTADVTASAA